MTSPRHHLTGALTVALTGALAGAVALLAACGGSTESSTTDTASGVSAAAPAADTVGGDVAVFAAASLTEAFTEIGPAFEAANPGVEVTFNFGASSALAQQITAGAPADVFAAASPATMATVTDAGDAQGEPTVFVRNRLQIAVPAGNPAEVTGLADFADTDKTIALCAQQAPCGSAAIKAFAAAGIEPAPDTLEQDVKATVTKVELGEVDAALVYRTDVQAAGDAVEGIDFPEAEQAVNDYPIVTLAEAPNAEAAQAFLDYVLSPGGRQVLEAAGFERP
jgi:molybdate transport system substrate-binding protein